jgi:lysophospholipase L1-like esterase
VSRSLSRGSANKLSTIRPHHYLHFELTPHYQSADGRITHNSIGFRGREFSVTKPANTTRIVCIGESTTYGHGVSDTETWPAYLEEKLKEKCATEVINAGAPAYTSSEILLNYIFKIEPLEPDWLVYYFTVNDVRPRQIGRVSRDYREFCRLWSERTRFRSLRDIETYLAYKDSISYRVRNFLYIDHSEANIFKTDGSVFRANIQDLLALATSRKVRVLLICPRFRQLVGTEDDLRIEDPISRAVAQHRDAIFDLGKEFGQPVLDMLPLMPKPPWSKAEQSDIYFDDVHMNAKGHNLFAGYVADILLEQMSREPP